MNINKITVTVGDIVFINDTRIGKVEAGKFIVEDLPFVNQNFAEKSGVIVPAVTCDGRRAMAPRVAEALELLDQFSNENTNILNSK